MNTKKNLFILIILLVILVMFFVFSSKKENKIEENVVLEENTTINNENGEALNQNQLVEEEKQIISKEETKKIMQATLNTNMGDITIEFFPDLAPKTVENFTKLAKDGFYDGVKFHRVIKGFMNQAGDPLSKDDSKMNAWGTGGPGYQFEDEIHSQNRNDKYTISMANAGPNTNGSQFFINANDNNFLDPKHTVFGKVVAGQSVVDAINNVETIPGYDRPVKPVIINKITLK